MPKLHTFLPSDPVTVLPGLGSKRAERLAVLGVETIEDLLRLAPRGYEDRGTAVPVAEALRRGPGSFAVLRGTLRGVNLRRTGRRSTLRATLEDDSGRITLFWFNAPFLRQGLDTGTEVVVAGRLSERRALVQPELARVSPGESVPERLTGTRAVYPLTDGLSQRFLRDILAQALDGVRAIADPLPRELREECEVEELAEAIRLAHRPRHPDDAERGRERLLFDELLPIELAMRRRLAERRARRAPSARREETARNAGNGGAEAFVRGLPFALTESQEAAVEDVVADVAGARPMTRMVLGEVGSGKTAVALAAIEEVRSLGLQCALLAPTELLARQHHRAARELLPGDPDRVVLLTGAVPGDAAREIRHRIAAGEAEVVIGTHALLSGSTRFAELGLVVIDEQQRFGVAQRESLLERPSPPHSLVLTATPIPRSLALLAFGDADVSTLETRPGARGEVLTRLVPLRKRAASLSWVAERLREGEQAFLVRPRIEGDSRGAEELFEELRAGPLAGIPVGLVHGRIPPQERDRVLEEFRAGGLAALVTTTVVEVGLDVAGASILWIEGAERLGLAQLHQLRGRIARRGQSGYCWIVEPDEDPGAAERLGVLAEVDDGARLAEIDLALRGPGELLGLRQSGRVGLFAGLGPNAPKRIASLAKRAWRAAGILLEREAKGEPCPDIACAEHSRP